MDHCNVSKHSLCTEKVELFQVLPREVQEKIANQAIHYEVSAHETIVTQGDVADFLLVIRKGKVKQNRYDENGKEYIQQILTDGDTIGEETFTKKGVFDFNLEAITPVKICKINQDVWLKALIENPELAISTIDSLRGKLDQMKERIILLTESNAMKRVLLFLLEYEHQINEKQIEWTVDDIAASTNLRRETVSRKLKELQDEKLIERLGQKQIQILNRKKLLEYSIEN